jgi:hypothetical protein
MRAKEDQKQAVKLKNYKILELAKEEVSIYMEQQLQLKI